MSSKFGEIRPWTRELAALVRLKKIPYTYNGDNHIFSAIYHLILFILAGKEDMHRSLD